MPRISKIRLTNIRYAQDSKVIPDMIIHTENDNSLLVLENGGGKSLILQLILQCMLPNARMNTRRISDMLIDAKFSGHVLVEWKLDAEIDNYLLTGFCFTNPTRDTKQLEYFNYANIYDSENEFNLQNIPLVTDQTPISYKALWEKIKTSKETRLQIFETRNSYHEFLSRFHIYGEEWENIRITNSEEGGVSKFFSNSKTSENILENILIPTIERALFENDSEKHILTNSFRDHCKEFLKIPVLKKNIQDYSKIGDLSSPLLDSVALHNTSSNKVNHSHRLLVGLNTFFKEEIHESIEKITKYNSEITEYKETLQNCLWKKESHHYFLNKNELDSITKEIDQLENKITNQNKKIVNHKELEQKFKAFDLYANIKSSSQECSRIHNRIDHLSKENPELIEKLTEILSLFSFAWEKKNEKNKLLCTDKNTEHFKLKEEIIISENNLVKIEKNEKTSFQEQVRVNMWLERYYEERIIFAQEFSAEETDKPELAQERYRARENYLLAEDKKCRLKIEEEKVLAKKNIQSLNDLAKQISKDEFELQQTNKKISIFELEHENLLGKLSLHKIVTVPDLLLHEKSIYLKLKNLQDSLKEEMFLLSAQAANIKAKLSYIQENPFLVPHPLLISIKKYLEHAGIAVIMGTEWLHAQTFTDSQKQNLVKNNPLLPFSFIAELSQINQIEKELLGFNDWDGDFPILCIPRTEENLSFGIKNLSNSTFVFKSESLHISWNESAFSEWKLHLIKKQKEYEEKLNTLQEKYDFNLKIEEKLNTFFSIYTNEQILSWKKLVQTYQSNILKSNEERILFEKLQIDIEEKIIFLENKKLDCNTEQLSIQKIKKQICAFILLHEKHDIQKQNKINIEEKICEYIQIKEHLKQSIKESHNNCYILLSQIKDLENELSLLRKIKEKYIQDKNPIPKETTLQYEHLLAEVESLTESLNSRQHDLGELRKSLERNRSFLKKEENELNALFFEWPSLNLEIIQDEWRIVPDVEKLNLKNTIQKLDQELIKYQQLFKLTQANYYKKEGILTEIQKNLYAKFDKNEPFNEYTSENHELILHVIQDEEFRLNEILTLIFKELNELKTYIEGAKKSISWIAAEIQDELLITQGYPFDDNEISIIQKDPTTFSRQALKNYFEIKEQIEKQKILVQKNFDEFLSQLRNCNNERLHEFIRETNYVLGNGKLFEFTYVSETFSKINSCIQTLKEQCEVNLEQLEINRNQLIERIVGRTKEIYKDLFEIGRNTRIKLYERSIPLVKIELPQWLESENYDKLSKSINQLIAEIQVMESNGKTEEDRNAFIQSSMSSKNLLNEVTPLNKIKIFIFKPRQESTLVDGKIDHLRWDEVDKWSGGEKFSACMFMFLALTSYLRSRTSGIQKSWRVLLADNPFGLASSKHILDPVFELASMNKIQMICFTAHRSEEIFKRFKSVYSLKLTPAFGKEHMRFEKLEKGFYMKPNINLDPEFIN